MPDQPLLWVDEKGLNDRAKLAMAEIAKADDYGLRASDYALPKPDQFNASDAKASDWLADAEIKVSYAVLDYANDARGGRLEPQRVSENLDPTLCSARSVGGAGLDRHPLRPRRLSAELPARPAAIRSAAPEAARGARRRQAGRAGRPSPTW